MHASQQGTADSLQLERGTDDERRADFVASLLGLRKVGWIFTQSVQEREFIMSTEEVCQIAAMQDELGEQAVTAVVSMVPSDDGMIARVIRGGHRLMALCLRLLNCCCFTRSCCCFTTIVSTSSPPLFPQYMLFVCVCVHPACPHRRQRSF